MLSLLALGETTHNCSTPGTIRFPCWPVCKNRSIMSPRLEESTGIGNKTTSGNIPQALLMGKNCDFVIFGSPKESHL